MLFRDMAVSDLLYRALMAIDGRPGQREVEMTIRQAVEMTMIGLGPRGQA
jgi:hypothetical protein